MTDPRTKFAIFDLDGCLADDRERFEKYHPDVNAARLVPLTFHDFAPYHDLCGSDPVLAPGLEELSRCIATGMNIVFVTSRPEAYRSHTTEWIRTQLPFSAGRGLLLMRPNTNTETSPVVKVRILNEHGIDWGSVAAAFDDRIDVLIAYREAGVRNLYVTTADGSKELRPASSMQTSLPLNLFPALGIDWTGDVYTSASPDGGHHDSLHGALESEFASELRAANPITTPEILEQMAETFRERNLIYGDNWEAVGRVMKAMFPDGLPDAQLISNPHWHLFEWMVTKITRYAVSGLTHIDSVHDIAVYAAMSETHLRRKAREK